MKWIIGIIVIIVLAGVGYWWYTSTYGGTMPAASYSPVSSTGSSTATTTAPSSGVNLGGNLTLGTNVSQTLGTYLVAYNGMTLYTYANDKTGVSTCSGSCAAAWPPYTVTAQSAAQLVAESPLTGSVGTITRTDGSLQVTYNGMPLYFWQGDSKPGDTTGNGVNGFSVAKP
jgi:predicted lipoprotein with Yx(FWY)xxD motif